MKFDPKHERNKIIFWIREWFDANGPDSPAIIGISGGKDSSVVAGLCVQALGADRVYGVLMPNGTQSDLQDSLDICMHLGIKHNIVNIADAVKGITEGVDQHIDITEQAKINLPPRIRMATLYFVSQCMNGRVANTCNLSEDYVGYSTKYGDAAGDFSPISAYTSEEVIEIGKALGIPDRFVLKPPADGLCGKTDEDNLGFTYAVLNKYIRTDEIEDPAIKARIDKMHRANLHKIANIPTCRGPEFDLLFSRTMG